MALSMLTLVPGAMGGSETYARELTGELATSDEFSVTAFVPRNAVGFSRGVTEVVVPEVNTGPSTVQRLRSAAAARLQRGRIDRRWVSSRIVHFPFTTPFPRPTREQAFVQTLHDVQHLDLPHLFGKAELIFRRFHYEGAARRADAVVTISEFTKGRIVDLLGIPEERVHVAHLGVDADSFVPHLGEREQFVLYPARAWKHKNHARLIEAMRGVRREHPQMRLVLTGGGLEQLGAVPEWVDVRGLVSDEELRRLYRTAAVLAFPSLYEGFGLPPLEAMASGCPVAATRAGAVPEVCGDAAVLFNPYDADAIAQGILDAMSTADELVARGLRQAQLFSWRRCRDAHLAVYRAVA